MKLLTIITAMHMMSAPQADGMSSQVFLEGFPDVPVLSVCREISPDDRLIFDTPAGTVAETHLSCTESGQSTLARYDEALGGLGWSCSVEARSVSCVREGYQLSLKALEDKGNSSILSIATSPAKRP